MFPSLEQIEQRRRRLLFLSYLVIFFLSATVMGLLFFIDGLVGLLNAVRYNAFLRLYLIVFVSAFIFYLAHKERQQFQLTKQLMTNLQSTSAALSEELRQDIFLNKTTQKFASFSSEQALEGMLTLAREHFEADGGAITRKTANGTWEELVASEASDYTEELTTEMARWIEKTGHPLVAPSQESAGMSDLEQYGGIGSVIGAPLRLRGKLHGVIALWRGTHRSPFTASQLRFLEISARQAAAATYNHEESSRDREQLTNVCRLIARATDKLSVESGPSSEQGGLLANLVALNMKLTKEEIRYITTAAFLKNIGLMTVPAELLGQSMLTDDEENVIEQHLMAGGELLRSLKFPRGVAELIPLSLRITSGHTQGRDIPLGAYVIAAVNVFLSLNSEQNASPRRVVEEVYRSLGGRLPKAVLAGLAAAVEGDQAEPSRVNA